jgi:protein TonB
MLDQADMELDEKSKIVPSFLASIAVYVFLVFLVLYILTSRPTFKESSVSKQAHILSFAVAFDRKLPATKEDPVPSSVSKTDYRDELKIQKSKYDKKSSEAVIHTKQTTFTSIPEPIPTIKPTTIGKRSQKLKIKKRAKVVHKRKNRRNQKSRSRKSNRTKKRFAHRRKSRKSRSIVKGNTSKSSLKNMIRKRINKNKRYPRAAERRGIRGISRASFTVLSSGGVGNIVISGPNVFRTATKSAILRAFPVTVSRGAYSLPVRMTISIRYQ